MKKPEDPSQESTGSPGGLAGHGSGGITDGGASQPPPRWWGVLFGRWILRVCSRSEAKTGHECDEEKCALRIYCKCAKENYEYGAALEQRAWMVLAVCGAAVILFWILRTQNIGS
jgi:hypothetical protein